ncbi:DUF6545 domain-containing protein [Nocardia amamiensis]|uniref:DUF6545 domain-containing protein n=1 Tax=Nocardia amamiensis TaxID=404578 RepID=UPI00083662E3|nr:DUF6545 domain-containing protein [Nocardia amamiensis]
MRNRLADRLLVLSVVQLLRLDRDSRALRRLYPVWRDLTAATPEVVLTLRPGDRRGSSTAERLHRRRVEILDAAAIVGRWAVPVPEDLDHLVEDSDVSEYDREALRSVRELAAASWRLVAIGGTHRAGDPPLSHYHVPDLKTLVRFWQPARDSAGHSGHGRTSTRLNFDGLSTYLARRAAGTP